MIFGRRRSNICGEDRATLGSVPSAPQGHRQTAAAFSSFSVPGGGCFFVTNWNRCLAPEANTPARGGGTR